MLQQVIFRHDFADPFRYPFIRLRRCDLQAKGDHRGQGHPAHQLVFILIRIFELPV